MPDSGWIAASGESEALINGGAGVLVVGVVVYVDSFSTVKVRPLSTVFPRRLQFGGSFTLLTDDDDPSGTLQYIPAFNIPVNFEMFEWDPPSLPGGSPSIFYARWKLPNSMASHIKLFW